MTKTARDPMTDVSSIQEFVTAGVFGFLQVKGPFSASKDGTLWTIDVPTNADDYGAPPSPTLSALQDARWQSAVILRDGEAVGGGLVTSVAELSEEEVLRLSIDQYVMGTPSGGQT